ncbi:MAG TPA: endonuclease/exonuclease/phosphatase family protein [Kofleriaceae bacterium]|nr:endonuclease/exonuclease/phosphatase family protein [Kofleriaceae bacterium]
MRTLAFVLALAACRDVPDPPVPIDAPEGEHVRLATFNVRRFFDTVCESGACATDDYEALPTQAAFEQRADQLATAIRTLDADLVALEEIETQACLDALLARLGDVMPEGVLGEIGTAASVDVAVLSTRPLAAVHRHRATNPLTLPDGTVTTFSRELLEVHVQTERGKDVVLLAAHFRSKVNDEPARRLAEAQAASRIVNERAMQSPGALVVLGGDLNDTPGSPPLNALVVDGALVRVADDLPIGAQATYVYQGNGQAIDHLLLAPSASVVRLPRSSKVWRDADGWGGSDHAALSSDFVLPY